MGEGEGIRWGEALGAWRVVGQSTARGALVDRHLDVVNDPTLAVVPSAKEPSPLEFLASWFSKSPRDRHLGVKRKLLKPYGEAVLMPARASMERFAAELADRLPETCDLVTDYLQPFALRGTAELLAVPQPEQRVFGKVVMALSAVLGRPGLDEQALRVTSQCMQYLHAFVTRALRMEEPPPVVAALRDVAIEGRDASSWLAVATIAQVLTAGFHPTVTGAAMAWQALHAAPTHMEALGAGTLELTDLVEETLRLFPPFPYLRRWAHARCDCLGVSLEPGDAVVIDVAACNRDPAVFVRPDELIGGRDRSATLSFGHGAHRCLGPALARLQVTVALQVLLRGANPPRPTVPITIDSTTQARHLVVVPSLPCARTAHGNTRSW